MGSAQSRLLTVLHRRHAGARNLELVQKHAVHIAEYDLVVDLLVTLAWETLLASII